MKPEAKPQPKKSSDGSSKKGGVKLNLGEDIDRLDSDFEKY